MNVYRISNTKTGGIMLWLWIFAVGLVPPWAVANAGTARFEHISALIGKKDAIVVADPGGQIVFAKNEKTKLVPASILKLFTSLVAMHHLGPRYRFATEFYLDGESNLKLKGYGDPLTWCWTPPISTNR
jgi:D-alanyl-D-alanine carboxypeptidase